MRYKDVANRLVATPAFSVNPNTAFGAVSVAVVALRAYQRACCLCQVLCSYQPKILVLQLAYCRRTCTAPCPPERHCHHRRVEVTDIYIFWNKVFFSSRGFLGIEKSVLLELNGVKIIRSYWDFYQLIRDFFPLIRDLFQMLFLYMYTCYHQMWTVNELVLLLGH